MPRELDTLVLHLQAQPLKTRQIAAFMDASLDVTRRTMRKLRDLGLVEVIVSTLEADNRYILGRAARPLLARHLGVEPRSIRIPRGLRKVQLDHHFATVDVAVALMCACRRSELCELVEFVFEDEIRRRTGAPPGTAVPDAIAIFSPRQERDAPGAGFAVCFEIDRHTENSLFFAKTKAAYADAKAQGTSVMGTTSWVVACVVPSERRRNSLITAMLEHGLPNNLWFFSTDAFMTPESVLRASAWVTPRLAADGTTATLASQSPLEAVMTNRSVRHDGSARDSSSALGALARPRSPE